MKANLAGTHSYQEVLDSVMTFAKRNQFSWILGFGWDQNDWQLKEYPDRKSSTACSPKYLLCLTGLTGMQYFVMLQH
jgi:predicted amidohydrolase YtcJ